MRAILAAAAAAALPVLGACAEGPASRPAPEVSIEGVSLDRAAAVLLSSARQPYGIVLADPPGPPWLRVKLRPGPVRRGLDRLVEADPRYEWTAEGGAIEIAPVGSRADASSVWNVRIGDVDLQGVSAHDAIERIFSDPALGGRASGAVSRDSASVTVNIRLRNPTLRAALDALVGSAGNLCWRGHGGRALVQRLETR